MNQRLFRMLSEHLSMMHRVRYKPNMPNGQKRTYHPFFSSLQVKREHSAGLDVMNGGTIVKERPLDSRYIGRAEVRMGDYKKGGAADINPFGLPIDLDSTSSRIELERITDETYRGCVEDYDSKITRASGSADERQVYLFFSRQRPVRFTAREKKVSLDFDKLEGRLKEVTGQLARDPRIRDASIHFYLSSEGRHLVNSEGSRIFTSFTRYSLSLEITSVDNKNLVVPHRMVWNGIDLSTIPDYDTLMAEGEKLMAELFDIIKAPIQRNGVFPVILDSLNHGVVWHEVVGHALEAHRMHESEVDGEDEVVSLFLDNIGEGVAPDFLSLYDDPLRRGPDGRYLDGHYPFDEDGVRAQRVELIRNGVLIGYLHSRQSAGFFRTKSNGHARAYGNNPSSPRMSNLVVESSNKVSYEELKEELMRICRDQGHKYGLLFVGTEGGSTVPQECHFDTVPANVFRIYPNGKVKRVRSAYIVGTPYQTLIHIVKTSDRYNVFNGWCIAESGSVPSTETAPDALVSLLEVNRNRRYQRVKNPILTKRNGK